jgi:AraC family transcriptional regulator of adaptative response/methylated-DNA-[protein]-cysteine methyltransferase
MPMPPTLSISTASQPRAPASALDGARWAAVVARDATFDGHFFYSVATTGIYCRPSCAARRPKRVHVRFHDSARHAEDAGFRPCKRCKPGEPSLIEQHAETVTEACRLIETADEAPRLDDLAAAVGLSPHHFHRIFKAVLGVTPKAYATAHRHKRVRDALGKSATITEAIYDAGFNSNGRFYATSSEVLGMTPTEFRSGGGDTEIKFAIGKCSLGDILVAASDKGVCMILFGNSRRHLLHELKRQFPRAKLMDSDHAFARLTTKVIDYVEDPRTELDLPLDIRGTAFQHRVWQALRRIPAGTTASYTEIATAVGAPGSARAVARACASNRIAVAIPCHRVVRSDGSLSGYRGGVARKRALLAKEAKS